MRIEKKGNLIKDLDDWWRFAPPKKHEEHWVDGRSAKECAKAWLENVFQSPPSEIVKLLCSHSDFVDLVVEHVEPEALLTFDSHKGPSNADLAIIARDSRGPVAITVEAKVDEPFGDTLSQVLRAATKRLELKPKSGGVIRINDLVRSILPPEAGTNISTSQTRYQLLTAVAGTIAHAVTIKAKRAIVIIHEFHTKKISLIKQAQNNRDLDCFVASLSQSTVQTLAAGQLVGPFYIPGAPLFSREIALYIGKAVRDAKNYPTL